MSATYLGARPADAPTEADYAAHRARMADIQARADAEIADITARLLRCHKLLDDLGAPRVGNVAARIEAAVG